MPPEVINSIGLVLQLVVALAGAFFLAFWVSLVIWTFNDIRSRTHDILAWLLASLDSTSKSNGPARTAAGPRSPISASVPTVARLSKGPVRIVAVCSTWNGPSVPTAAMRRSAHEYTPSARRRQR